MSGLTNRDAMQLVNEIRRARVSAIAIAQRTNLHEHADNAFLGGLESVLAHFLQMQGCSEASKALPLAMNHSPSADEIAARNAEFVARCAAIDKQRRGAAHG